MLFKQVHIVYLGGKQHDDPMLKTDSHHDMLASIVGRYGKLYLIVVNQNHSDLLVFYSSMLFCSKEIASELMVYSYKHGFSGFAAKLTESQAQKVAGSCTNKHYLLSHLCFPTLI